MRAQLLWQVKVTRRESEGRAFAVHAEQAPYTIEFVVLELCEVVRDVVAKCERVGTDRNPERAGERLR